MNTKVQAAVERLNKILPLAERQQQLDAELADAYQNMLHSYVKHGRGLSKNELAEQLSDVDESIRTFKRYDMIVFDNNDEPTGAYPFTMEQREHEVSVNGRTVHCMCALDALAVSPMFDQQTTINSRCQVTGKPVAIRQQNMDILDKDNSTDVFFGISWNSAANNCCASSLCTEMIFLKGQQTASDWLAEDSCNREIFDLNDAIQFAAGFFTPLITRHAV